MIKQHLPYPWLLLFMLIGHYCQGQYFISGQLDASFKNKRIYLSLLRYDETYTVTKEQILTSTLTDSTGYFSITGKLLSDKHKLYRIHANLDDDSEGLDFADVDELKNFHNFIFTNFDTLELKKSGPQWFAPVLNTNTVNKEWREISNYKTILRKEFSGTINKEAKNQASFQILSELKSYVERLKTHPLVKLILISEIQEINLKTDFETNSDFYDTLEDELNTYYLNKSYSSQFKDLISNLSIAKTQQQLNFFKQTTYVLGALSLVLLVWVLFFLFRTKKQPSALETISLTNQEEKIAELIIQDKTNKEIASELFISLSTVKTHIRNLYAKYEVSNRQQFTDKIKNHPRD